MKDIKKDMKMAFIAKEKTQQDLADACGISQQAISEWLKDGRIPEKHWEKVKGMLDLEPSVYSPTTTGKISDNANSSVIVATNSARVKSKHSVKASSLTPKEQEALRLLRKHGDRAFDALSLFDKYGNERLLEKCLGTLRQAQAIFG